MLDINGNVSTCNSTNFFIIKDGEVWTSTGDYCLNGVTRKAVINLCLENNISVYQKDFLIMDVYSADEAFVTGTFAGIIPAVKIDDQILCEGNRGNLTYSLQKLYKEKLMLLYPDNIDK